ncbi:MAG: hypothetical protein HY460_01495 [Parcubacteria group bacterium]|nr:hypothetical protein [Parcubacteria group bacterium]
MWTIDVLRAFGEFVGFGIYLAIFIPLLLLALVGEATVSTVTSLRGGAG